MRFWGALTAVGFIIATAACAPGDDGTYTLHMSTQLSESSPMVEGFHDWSEAVYERTNGAVEIVIHPDGQLGSDENVIDQALQGADVAVLTDGGRMSNYVHDVGIIGMPYLVDNYAELRAITETDIFASFDEQFADHGISILAYNWYDGPRNFYTNREVDTPEDLNGQRVRTPAAPVWSRSVSALGAAPVDMPWGDAYNAVQSGAIEGVEVQTTSAWPSSTYEVTSHMARTEHFQLANFIMVGDKWFDSIPKHLQTVLMQEAQDAAARNAELVLETSEEFEANMVDEGLIIHEPDVDAFRRAAEKAYDELGFADLRDQLWQEIGKQ